MNAEEINEILAKLPDEDAAKLAEDITLLHSRMTACESVLHECKLALLKLFTWHNTYKSRESTLCDEAIHQAEAAASLMGTYLMMYGEQPAEGEEPQQNVIKLVSGNQSIDKALRGS